MSYLDMLKQLEGQSEKAGLSSTRAPESLPDITDTLHSVSGLSGPDLDNLLKNARPETSAALPVPPIRPGWLITYRASDGRLQGGDFDRAHAAVAVSIYGDHGWTFTLTDGKTVPMQAIRGVAKKACDGRIVAGWTVREHGLEGEDQR
jgi:hypothetical protein